MVVAEMLRRELLLKHIVTSVSLPDDCCIAPEYFASLAWPWLMLRKRALGTQEMDPC